MKNLLILLFAAMSFAFTEFAYSRFEFKHTTGDADTVPERTEQSSIKRPEKQKESTRSNQGSTTKELPENETRN